MDPEAGGNTGIVPGGVEPLMDPGRVVEAAILLPFVPLKIGGAEPSDSEFNMPVGVVADC